MSELVVQSADGTRIHCERYGEGRALVIVSGALFARQLWQRAVPLLSETCALYVVDRRGRGDSGNVLPYAPEREIEDLQAVLANLPGPVDVLGHSSGAILALELASLAPANLRRLVVYEPPVFFADPDRIAGDLPERLDALLAEGRAEAAVETFFREGPRASDVELRSMKAGPAWAQMVNQLGHTVAYDSRVQRRFSRDSMRAWASIQNRTLMLVGGGSPARMRTAAETVARALVNAELHELEGQQHVAMLTAPALFAAAVNSFLLS